MNKKQVCFFVSDLNTTFVVNEVILLSGKFDKVSVYVFDNSVEYKFKSNVTICSIDYKGYSTSCVLKKHLFSFLSIALREFFSFPKYIFHLKKYNRALSELLRSFFIMDKLMHLEKRGKNDVLFYTYWFNQWATVLSIAKKKGLIPSYITRAHGTDLYEYRVPEIKHIAFRKFQLKNVKHVISVSKTGANYLINKYPSYASKVHFSYLGTKDNSEGFFNETEIYTIVSCAHVRNIKRIYLIPEILLNIDFPVRWLHIGGTAKDDPTYKTLTDNMEQLAQKNKSVEFKMLGALSQEEVIKFYKTTSVNLFLSVSATEGLPVSMMEAISYGIPILATDVGGCKEIVTEITGALMPVDFSAKYAAEQIYNFKNSNLNTNSGRKAIRDFWKASFEEEKNFNSFTNQIFQS